MQEGNKLLSTLRNSIGLKAVLVALLALLLLIPMIFVTSLIHERNSRREEVVREIADKWGERQTLIGPIIRVPVREFFTREYREYREGIENRKNRENGESRKNRSRKNRNGREDQKRSRVGSRTDSKENNKESSRENIDGAASEKSREITKSGKSTLTWLYILPKSLAIAANLNPEIRYRSLYETVVYESDIELSGRFSLRPLENLNLVGRQILADQASFILGISDLRGIAEEVSFFINDSPLPLLSGSASAPIGPVIQSQNMKLNALDGATFRLKLKLRGSESWEMLPAGEISSLKLSSKWPHPSFIGAFLPENRSISDAGFQSSWKVFHFNRAFPQAWIGPSQNLSDALFGVELLIPADLYQQSLRAAKYAIMLIGFTFIAFFFSESLNAKKVHPIQYILVGLALVLFYLLLVALSEHIGFGLSYLLAGGATIVSISLYSAAILRSKRLSLLVAGILAVLYLFFYILLQLESFALLLGSIGLFIALSLIMYVTRKINWYQSSE